jgi:hypothetical protein
LELKLSISPFLVLVSDLVPALLADRVVFAFYLDIEFDVFTFAVVVPGVSAMFTVFFHIFSLSS